MQLTCCCCLLLTVVDCSLYKVSLELQWKHLVLDRFTIYWCFIDGLVGTWLSKVSQFSSVDKQVWGLKTTLRPMKSMSNALIWEVDVSVIKRIEDCLYLGLIYLFVRVQSCYNLI